MVRDPRLVENRLWIFPASEGSKRRTCVRSAIRADSWRIGGVDSIAEPMAHAQPGQVYAYRFDWDEEVLRDGLRPVGRARRRARTRNSLSYSASSKAGFGLSYLYPEDSRARCVVEQHDVVLGRSSRIRAIPGTGRDGNEVHWLPWGTDGQRTIILDTTPPGIRMSPDLITIDSLKQRLVADTSITDHGRAAASTYARLFRGAAFDNEQYLHLGKEGLRPVRSGVVPPLLESEVTWRPSACASRPAKHWRSRSAVTAASPRALLREEVALADPDRNPRHRFRTIWKSKVSPTPPKRWCAAVAAHRCPCVAAPVQIR